MVQILLNGIIVGGIYGLISVGFALIFSAVRFYHLPYGAVAIFGAYCTWFLQEHTGLNFFASASIVALAMGCFGVLFWEFFYAPLQRKKTSAIGMIVASFGLLIVFQNLTALTFGNTTKTLALTDTIVPGYNFSGLTITYNQLIILSATVIIAVLFELFLQQTKWGSAIRAVGQNHDLAKIIGIPSERVIQATFFLATAISVLGASLIALEIGLRPTHGFALILKIVIASVIGGIGSVRGAFLGGLFLGILENFGIEFFGANWQDTVAFLVLVVFLLFLPQGIFGTRR